MIAPAFAAELLERFGSPLYAYDLDEVDHRLAELRAALPERSELFYSLKANPLPAIAGALAARGVRAEVSSPGELEVALDAGFDPAGVLYTGPGKSEDEVRHALRRGVALFSCESGRDLRRLERCADEEQCRAGVLFRVNPPDGSGNALAMSGVPSQFGFDPARARALLRCVRSGGPVRPLGLHVYYGTQIRDAATLAAQAGRILALADELFAGIPGQPRVVDLGGGFPWPFGTHGPAPDLSGLRSALEALPAGRAGGAERWFESGRYLAASAGTLLASVLDVKESHGRRFVVLDAGINHLGGIAGLGRLHLPALAIEPLGGHEGEPGPATVVGPLCTPLDVLARGDRVAPLRPGDRVAIPNVGAYAATASLTGFLSRPPAAEVACRGQRVCAAYRLRSGHERIC